MDEHSLLDPPPVTDDLGEVVAGYRLEERIASGGMGHVYSATHLKLGRRAAVKLLNSKFVNDPSVLSRFYHEARIANEIRHPNIVDIFDFVELTEPRRVACVMELLVGPSLRNALKASAMTAEQAIHVTVQLGDALAAVHERGVIHRDLKPENVVLIGDLTTSLALVPSVKLLDFGIAKLPEAMSTHKTGTGLVLGTPAYMAPEQISGEAITAATDVYALGELFFEMLSGRRAFPGKAKEVFRQKLTEKGPALALPILTPDREELGALIARCLEPSPELRIGLSELQGRLRDRLDHLGPLGSTRPVTTASAPAHPTVPARSPSPLPATPALGFALLPPSTASAPTADIRPAPSDDLSPAGDTPAPIPALVVEGRGGEAPTGPPRPSPLSYFDRAPPTPFREVTPRAPLPVPEAPKMVRPHFALSLLLVVGLVGTLSISSTARQLVGEAIGRAGALLLGDQSAPLTLSPSERQRLHARRDAITARAQSAAADAPELEILAARNHQNTDRADGYRAAMVNLTRGLAGSPESPAMMAEWARAVALARQGRMTAQEEADARAVLTLAAERQPSLPAIDLAEAELALARRLWGPAIARASVVLAQLPEDATARVTLAGALAHTNPTRALAELALATRAGGGHQRRADRFMARALAGSGRYQAAFDVLDKRLKADPKNATVLKLYGDLEAELGHNSKALARYDAAAAGEGDRASAHLAAGWLLLEQRAFSKAEERFTLVVKDVDAGERLRGDALVGQARVILNRRDPHFPDTLRSAIAGLGKHPGALLAEAELTAQGGAWAKAASLLRSLEGHPEAGRAVSVLLSRAALAQGEGAQADRLLEQALAAAPWDAELRVVLAAAHLDQGRTESAVALIRGVGAMDPRARPRAQVQYPVARSVVEDARRRWDGASKEGTLAPEARVALAMLASAEGRDSEAKAHLQAALKADPKLSAAQALLWSMSGPDEALTRAKAWALADRSSAYAQLALGRALSAKGQKDAALKAYADCLAAEPALELALLEQALLGSDGAAAAARLASALEAHFDWPAIRFLARAQER